jgi:hypothetical protein
MRFEVAIRAICAIDVASVCSGITAGSECGIRKSWISRRTKMMLLRNGLVLFVAIVAGCSDPGSVRTPSMPSESSPLGRSTVLAGSGAVARTQGKPLSNLSVTTSISSVVGDGAPADITNDGFGSYPDGVNGVTSILTTNGYNGIAYGDWQFDTKSSVSRGVGESLDMDDAVQPGDPHFTVLANPPFWGTQVVKAKVEVECTFLNKSMLTMAAGASITCGLINGFVTAAGVDYGFSAAASFTGLPETTDAQIDCLAADSVGCSSWNIRPIGSTLAVARLGQQTKHGGIDEGDFYLRFLIHVTRP